MNVAYRQRKKHADIVLNPRTAVLVHLVPALLSLGNGYLVTKLHADIVLNPGTPNWFTLCRRCCLVMVSLVTKHMRE